MTSRELEYIKTVADEKKHLCNRQKTLYCPAFLKPVFAADRRKLWTPIFSTGRLPD